jgi:mono/diheme cytochrome c family protein
MAKWIAGALALLLLFTHGTATARADEPPGAKLYATYCGACHGTEGKGGFAPAIGSDKYLSSKDDATITLITAEGKAATGMPAWGKSKGGTLTDDQITDIVSYLRSFAPSAQTAAAPGTTAPSSQPSAPPTAAVIYVQTKMKVTQSAKDGETVLNVALQEYDGYPVGGATIKFSRPTLFGTVDLGTAKTDAAGNASFVVSNVPDSTEVVAAFKGEKNLDASETKIALERTTGDQLASNLQVSRVKLSVDEPLLEPEGSLVTPNPPLVPTTLFLLVVGGVWSIYGYVVYQIMQIWQRRRRPERGNVLRIGGSNRF